MLHVVHEREYEEALDRKVQEVIDRGGLGLERRYQAQNLQRFTSEKEAELAQQGKSLKTLSPQESQDIQTEFDEQFRASVKAQVLRQGLTIDVQYTPTETLKKDFDDEFHKKFHSQYEAHCKNQISHYENEIRVHLAPKDPKLNLTAAKDIIERIQQTSTGKSKNEKLAIDTCIGILAFIEKLESKIALLTTEGLIPKEAGDVSLGINMLPQLLHMLAINCESPKAKKIMAQEFPALYQQIQGINLDIQAAQMRCETSALKSMQGEIAGKKEAVSDVMLGGEELRGGPIKVAPTVVQSQTGASKFAQMKQQLHSQMPEGKTE